MVASQSNKKPPLKWWTRFALAGALIFLLWTWSAFFLTWYFGPSVSAGSFGDSFGVVNALFSGLAFAAPIVALLMQREDLMMQREELGLQRQELADTRQVLTDQKEQLLSQANTLKQQAFEGTFFQLLRLHLDRVTNLKEQIRTHPQQSPGTAIGVDVISRMSACVKSSLDQERRRKGQDYSIDDARAAFAEAWKANEKSMLQFFRGITSILRMLGEVAPRSGLDLYCAVLVSHLSLSEQKLIAQGTILGKDDNVGDLLNIVHRSQLWNEFDLLSLVEPPERELVSQETRARLVPGLHIIDG